MKRIQKNWVEWSVFGLGLVLVVAALAYLAYEGATMGGDPPNPEVSLGAPVQRAHNFIVPVSVTNRGDETAEGVLIEVVSESAGQESERGELTIAFIPRRATREGFVTFTRDPRAARLRARVLGYEKP